MISCSTKNTEVKQSSTLPKEDLMGWAFESQRDEIAPDHFIDENILFENSPTLAMEGDGKSYANGQWFKDVDVEQGKYYQFRNWPSAQSNFH